MGTVQVRHYSPWWMDAILQTPLLTYQSMVVCMKERDDNKLCNQQIKHDYEALALLQFVKIGEQAIAEHAQSFEDVETFLSEI